MGPLRHRQALQPIATPQKISPVRRNVSATLQILSDRPRNLPATHSSEDLAVAKQFVSKKFLAFSTPSRNGGAAVPI
jgi:hypothetical protein